MAMVRAEGHSQICSARVFSSSLLVFLLHVAVCKPHYDWFTALRILALLLSFILFTHLCMICRPLRRWFQYIAHFLPSEFVSIEFDFCVLHAPGLAFLRHSN